MEKSQAIQNINFYTEIYVNVVSRFVKTNTCGLNAGRQALKMLECPEIVINEIEKSMLNELNKNSQ